MIVMIVMIVMEAGFEMGSHDDPMTLHDDQSPIFRVLKTPGWKTGVLRTQTLFDTSVSS